MPILRCQAASLRQSYGPGGRATGVDFIGFFAGLNCQNPRIVPFGPAANGRRLGRRFKSWTGFDQQKSRPVGAADLRDFASQFEMVAVAHNDLKLQLFSTYYSMLAKVAAAKSGLFRAAA